MKKVTFTTNDTLSKTIKFLEFLKSREYLDRVEHYAKKGVVALELATPFDAGEAAQSWDYKIEINNKVTRICWTNSKSLESGYPIVLLVQYGHATRTGTWYEGYDFINPAMKPIFDDIKKSMWEEIRQAYE